MIGKFCLYRIALPLLDVSPVAAPSVNFRQGIAFVPISRTSLLHTHVHFYDRVEFYLLLLALIVLGMWGIYRSRVRLMQKQRDELEVLVQRRTQEIERQKQKIEQAYHNMKLLSEMGQDIISTLSVETIARRVYHNVQQLMSADCFGVGVYVHALKRIEFRGVMEGNRELPFHFEPIDGPNRLSVYCFNRQEEIVVNEYAKEYHRYINTHYTPAVGEDAVSILYVPLKVKEKPVGVVTVQSFQKHAYNDYHLNLLRNLAAYIAIAVDNAQALEDLKATQVQLVQAEKMASLGQLAAGIAHEINNPINYIANSVRPLRQDLTDLQAIVHSLTPLQEQPLLTDEQLRQQLEAIRQFTQRMDAGFILEEMESLLEGIEEGSARTQEIVAGMRNFARSDINQFHLANVHEGIDSTLRLLGNLLKNRITVHKSYGPLAEIECLPGKLNQVFMNILSNAIQAIEGTGDIWIQTREEAGTMLISIRDNGMGMPDEVKNRIFEPFYTTKKVGEGTGLGLSISFGIIEEHGGKIEVDSQTGHGTRFLIKVPVKQPS